MSSPLNRFKESTNRNIKGFVNLVFCDNPIIALFDTTPAPRNVISRTFCPPKRPEEPEVPNRPVDRDFDYPPPQPNNTIIDIDITVNNNINVIKPPPRIIYQPRFEIEIEYPELPDRTLPDIEQTPERDVTSPVRQNLANHKFGCLLAKPYTKGNYDWCDYQLDDPVTFWENLLDKALQAIEDYLFDELTDKINTACKLGVALVKFNYLAKAVLMIGCDQISEISNYYLKRNYHLNNLRITGKLHLGDVNIVECPLEPDDIEEDDFNLTILNDCGIPLQLYEDNEGIKPPQLQILWRSRLLGAKKVKQMTFPNPLDPSEISSDMLRQILPRNFYFGDVLYYVELALSFQESSAFDLTEQTIRGKAKMRIFGSGDDRGSQDSFIYTTYRNWLDRLTKNAVIEGYTPILKTETRWEDLYMGDFYPYSATWMCWAKDQKIWTNVAKWFIYKTPPRF